MTSRARLWLLAGLLGASLLGLRGLWSSLPRGPGHVVVADWAQLPEGAFLGTPGGAPARKQLDAWAAGEGVPLGLTAFAGVAVDSRGRVFAFHRGLEGTTGAIPPDTTTREHPIVVFGPDGTFERWAGDGIEGGIRGPHFLAVDSDDRLWVIAREGHRIVRLDEDLHDIDLQIGVTGEPGDDATHLNGPTDLAFASTGELIVTDGYGNHRVVKLTADGRFLEAWGGGPESAGDAPGAFRVPHGVVVDWRDRIYVNDRDNRRVQILGLDGEVLQIWDHLGIVWGIALGPDRGRGGSLWVTDVSTETVLEVDIETGEVLDQFGGIGRAPGQLDGAHGIAVDGTGAVYVADTWGQRLQKFVRRR